MEKEIKVIIIDDEEGGRFALRLFCEQFPEIIIQGECKTVAEALVMVRDKKPDLVFLDIEMPGGTGFDFIAQYGPIDFEIVFATAYENFTIQAIRSNALDYLIKPIGFDDFKDVIGRFKERFRSKISFDRYKLLMENINGQFVDKRFITLTYKKHSYLLQQNTIIYIHVNNKTSEVITIDNKYFVDKSLTLLEENLDNPIFKRAGNSYLINVNYIESYDANTQRMFMRNGDKLDLKLKVSLEKWLKEPPTID